MRILVGFVAVALVVAVPGRADEPTRRDLLEAAEQKLKSIYEASGPAAVCVVVSRSDQYPKPPEPPDYPGRLGGYDWAAFLKAHPNRVQLTRRLDLSDTQNIPDHGAAGGVILDASGLILVNAHTIEGAAKVYVHLPGKGGSYADIHASDARSDLAVLKLLTPPAGLKAVKFGTARLIPTASNRPNVAPGQLIAVLSNGYESGFAVAQPSIALGTVANIRRPNGRADGPERPRSVYNYSPLIEFDARPNPGISGAAVLNLDGEMIGLSSTIAAVVGESGTEYALPLDEHTQRIIETLKRGEEVEYGFLGVILRGEGGAGLPVEVSPRGPAEAAGMADRDRIIGIDGRPVRDYADLLWHAGSALAGSRVRVSYLRGTQRRTADVVLGKYKSDTPFIASVRPAPVFGLRVDYGSVLMQALGVGLRAGAEVPPGVAVRELLPDSPAAARFKPLGENGRWLVTAVNGTPTPTPAEFYRTTKGQQSVKLTVRDLSDAQAQPQVVTLP